MSKGYWRFAAISFLLSILAFFSLTIVHTAQVQELRSKERFFSTPLVVFSQELVVRNDRNAKGHYWAKRDGGRRHKGVDLLCEVGRPVLASRSGRIAFAGHGKGYGLYVEIAHSDGFVSRYAHLSAVSVQKGEWVSVGHIIGLSGRTGNADDPSIRPHLHYEIRLSGTPVNPSNGFLDPQLKIAHRN